MTHPTRWGWYWGGHFWKKTWQHALFSIQLDEIKQEAQRRKNETK